MRGVFVQVTFRDGTTALFDVVQYAAIPAGWLAGSRAKLVRIGGHSR